VTVTGKGVYRDSIVLLDGGSTVGTTTVASNGTWTLTVNLGVGVHSLTATQSVSSGATSDPSAASSVTVLPPAPAAPTIGSQAAATISSGLTLTGTGAAGNSVTIYDNGTIVGTATVASNGAWSLGVTLWMGSNSFTTIQTDSWGQPSPVSSTVTVVLWTQPAPPAITSTSVGSLYHGSATVTVNGTGLSGETITLYDGSTVIGTTTVAANGTWQIKPSLGSGSHTLTATQTVVAGVTSNASGAVVVTVPSH
jgi:large repetitive protein